MLNRPLALVPEVSARAAICDFLNSQSNEEYFDNWQVAIDYLGDLGPNTLPKSWFYWWCYENIMVWSEHGRHRLFPQGFEYDNRVKAVWVKMGREYYNGTPLPIGEDLVIEIPDPTPLLTKLDRLGVC